jgi:hypothetical protein
VERKMASKPSFFSSRNDGGMSGLMKIHIFIAKLKIFYNFLDPITSTGITSFLRNLI